MHKKEPKQYFEEIITEHKGILFKIALNYCQDETDRQDLIQEMMLQIWQSLHKYNGQFQMSTWLYRISLNVAISFYRKNKSRLGHQIALKEQIPQPSIEDSTEEDRKLYLLQQFIDELREIDKALMILYLEDKSHAEIAQILGISVSNVGTKVARIKEKLRTRFSKKNKQ